jgi:DNA-binding CsgD family transcriptional regulator
MHSELLLKLYRHARLMPAAEFHEFAIQLVRPVLRFQSACWGLGYFQGASIDSPLLPLAQRTLEIDPESTADWVEINRADKVIPIALAAQNATCNFHAPTLFSGPGDSAMREYARRYGRQCYMITVIRGNPGSIVEWLSVYRPDPDDHFSEAERVQCQLLVKHLCEASKVNCLTQCADADFLRSLDDQSELPFSPTGNERFDAVAAMSALQPIPEQRGSAFVAKYRITPAEWRVALRLADGHAPAQIARDLKVSLTTVRTHIRGLLAKTGTHRLAEIVAKVIAARSG